MVEGCIATHRLRSANTSSIGEEELCALVSLDSHICLARCMGVAQQSGVLGLSVCCRSTHAAFLSGRDRDAGRNFLAPGPGRYVLRLSWCSLAWCERRAKRPEAEIQDCGLAAGIDGVFCENRKPFTWGYLESGRCWRDQLRCGCTAAKGSCAIRHPPAVTTDIHGAAVLHRGHNGGCLICQLCAPIGYNSRQDHICAARDRDKLTGDARSALHSNEIGSIG
jgi:hypothetical protein